jgi:hypothetical protein
MDKLLISIFSTLLLSNSAFAVQPTVQSPTNSFSQAVLERQASQHRDDKTEVGNTNSYRHVNEQGNSLARGALAKQGVGEGIIVTSMDQVSATQYDPHEERNSLLRAALSLHYKATH